MYEGSSDKWVGTNNRDGRAAMAEEIRGLKRNELSMSVFEESGLELCGPCIAAWSDDTGGLAPRIARAARGWVRAFLPGS